jgi:hypothetical protein
MRLAPGALEDTIRGNCMTRRRMGSFILVAIVLVLGQLATAMPSDAADGINGAHWARKNNPFTLKIGDNVDNSWDGYLKRAASDWNKSKVVNTDVVGGSAGSRCKPTDGRVEVCNDRYGATGWLGITEVYADSHDHIIAARCLMNDTYFSTSHYDDPTAKRHTMTHEMGHSLGLDHRSGKSVMNDSESAVFRYDRPTSNDYDKLEQIYRHKDKTTTVDAAEAPFSVASIDPGIPTVAKDAGPVSVRNLDNGGKVITYITRPNE